MNILNISFEKTGLPSADFLDHLTLPEQKAGVNTEKYWMLNTDVFDKFLNPDMVAQKFAHLLYAAYTKDFQCLMITK